MIHKKTMDGDGYYSPQDELGFTRMTTREENELFLEYARTKQESIRAALIEKHLLFVAGEAIKVAPSWMPIDEIISAANTALMKAIDRFDGARGVRFSHFVRKFVRGEVVQTCRDRAPVYVPSAREIPKPVNWTDIEIVPDDAFSGQVPEAEAPDNQCQERDHLEFMQKCIRLALNDPKITALERYVVEQHFFEGKSYGEIGRSAPPEIGGPGLSRQRVEQIKCRVCEKLKKLLQRHGIRGWL